MRVTFNVLLARQVCTVGLGVALGFYAALGDISIAAFIAGCFTCLNTWLNARISRHVKETKKIAKDSTQTLAGLVEKESAREGREKGREHRHDS